MVFKVGLEVVNILYVPLFWSVFGDRLGEEASCYYLGCFGRPALMLCVLTPCLKFPSQPPGC